MNTEVEQQTYELIKENLHMPDVLWMSEDEMLEAITLRVNELLANDRALLISYLYRLDIAQNRINAVMRHSNIIPTDYGLALLILQRQKERVYTKWKYKVKPIEDQDWDKE